MRWTTLLEEVTEPQGVEEALPYAYFLWES